MKMRKSLKSISKPTFPFKKRIRRHSAPGSFNSGHSNSEELEDNEFELPPLPLNSSLCVQNGVKLPRDPLKDLKVSYQSIKCLFPRCQVDLSPRWVDKKKVTKKRVQQIDIASSSLSSSSPVGGKETTPQLPQAGSSSSVTGGEKEEGQVHSSWEDKFIEVEWDNPGGEKTQQYYNDKVESKPNVIVREILVLKPSWLEQDCKKVTFRDFQINLTDCLEVKHENKDLSKGTKTRKKKKKEKRRNLVKEEEASSSLSFHSSKSVETEIVIDCKSKPSGVEDVGGRTPVKLERKASETKTEGTPKHQCLLCNRTFSNNSQLFRHILWHTGEKPYKCNTCNQRFRHQRNWRRHVRRHTERPSFKCPSCGATFTRRENRRRHMRIHTGEKPYRCTDCQESFAQTYQLKIHVGLIHNCSSPYQCKFCKRSFTRSSYLNKHVEHRVCEESQRAALD